MRRRGRLAVALLTAGCAEAILPPPTATVLIHADPEPPGGAWSAVVGSPLPSPLRVQVEREGVGVEGVVVHWATSGEGGALVPVSSVTDANGIAAAHWTMPLQGGPKVAVAYLDDPSVLPLVFRARAEPAAPHALRIVEGDGQYGAAGWDLSLPLHVRIVDAHDNPVPGVRTIWDVVLGNGLVLPLDAATDAGGVARARWTLGDEGMQQVSVRLDDDDVEAVTFRATALPSAGATRVVVGNHFFREAQVRIPRGSTVIWEWDDTGAVPHSVRSGAGSIFPSSPVLLGAGARHAVQFTVAGTYDYDCAVHGNLMSGRITVE